MEGTAVPLLGGAPGAVPIVLAIYPLLFGIALAPVLFDLTFFVVILSAVTQGWSLPLVARALGLQRERPPAPVVELEISSLQDVNGDIVEYGVPPDSDAAGLQVRDLALPEAAVVAMIARGSTVIPPRGSTVIQPGDHVFVVITAERAQVDRVFSSTPREAPAYGVQAPPEARPGSAAGSAMASGARPASSAGSMVSSREAGPGSSPRRVVSSPEAGSGSSPRRVVSSPEAGSGSSPRSGAARGRSPGRTTFPLPGTTTLAEIEEFYGVVVEGAPPERTVGEELARRLGSGLRVGRGADFGGAKVHVRTMTPEGTVGEVELYVPPV